MPAYQLFSIVCSRNINNVEGDDVITIQPRWNEISEDCKMLEYVVRNKVAPCSGSQNSEQILVGSNFQNYVGNLIDLLTVDIQPFKQIQFDFPCIPSVVVTPEQLPSIRHAILGATTIIQNSWPIVVVKKKVIQTGSQSLNPYADPFIPKTYCTPQRTISRSTAPPPIERNVPRHIFFDEEDGHVTRYFN